MPYHYLSENVRQYIDRSVLCWLATVDTDGQPNVSPKELFTYSATEDEVLVAMIASPRTMKNLKANARVSLSFVDVFVQKGFKLNGSARLWGEGESGFADRLPKLREMAGEDFTVRQLLAITVTAVEPIIAPRYRFYPDTTEAEQIASAHATYGLTQTAGNYWECVHQQFRYYRSLGDRTFRQLSDEDLFKTPGENGNSIAVIVNHLYGNMRSRWTDFLTTDGEKEWRHRDQEFEDVIKDRAMLLERWEAGWKCLFDGLESAQSVPLSTIVYIRNKGHTVTEAVNRQLAHYAYHIGQIAYLGRMFSGVEWKSLSVPKGESEAYNAKNFAKGKRREFFTKEFLDREED